MRETECNATDVAKAQASWPSACLNASSSVFSDSNPGCSAYFGGSYKVSQLPT